MVSCLDATSFDKPALFFEIINKNENLLQCRLCSHYCIIENGNTGKCMLRKNLNGKLYTMTYALADSFAIDPIEKKPFYHYKPKSKVLSFGTPGCNFHCLNCQNWQLSQALRFGKSFSNSRGILPSQIAEAAIASKVDGIAYTYSEPTIFFEYALDTIKECRKNPLGTELFHIFVSNGYFSHQLLDFILNEQIVAAINIDLKFIDEKKYKKYAGASLLQVLESIHRLSESKSIHVEVINLLISGVNDSDEEIRRLVDFIKSVSIDLPLHFSRFHPQYKMQNIPTTPNASLLKAKSIAQEAGLRYVYLGNTTIANAENTYCPSCNALLIERNRYECNLHQALKPLDDKNAVCPNCGQKISLIL